MARDQGRLRQARRLLDSALELARRALGPWDPLVAAILNQLGILGKATGEFPAAGRHYLKALTIVRRHPDNDYIELADLYHNLGGLEHARGRWAVGEPLARRAVQVRARRHGADATATWLDRTAHAALLDGLRRFSESERIYRAALPRFRRRLGPWDYEVAVTLNNLGCVCAERGRAGEAIRHLRKALAIKQRKFGTQHVEMAIGLNNLASVLQQAGRAEDARPLLRRALAIFSRRLGPTHPSTRACRANLTPQTAGTTSRLGVLNPPS